MSVRISTLAEVKALSLASLILRPGKRDSKNPTISPSTDKITQSQVEQAIQDLSRIVSFDFTQATVNNLFTTVGLARNIRVDTDYGTTNIYGIGAPTRPRIVPNNLSINITLDRLQLDRRNGMHYITSPEYFYSHNVQRFIGIADWLLYTYLFVRSKEDTGTPLKIYAVMPRSSSEPISAGDVMVVNSVQMIGFQYTFEQLAEELLDNIKEWSLTGSIINDDVRGV